VVVLERAGKPVALGTVLQGDGRIMTALSALGNGNNLDARFADGSVSRVRVGHSDRAWDLALLVPQNGRWKDGLQASGVNGLQAGADLRAFSLQGSGSPQTALSLSRTLVKGETTLLGGDSELLKDALELSTRFKDSELGGPILDSQGRVVALVASACVPAKDGGCNRVSYGVPMSAMRAFLRAVPPSAVPPAPWLGIQGGPEDTGTVRGVRVFEVLDGSPAAAAGLSAGGEPVQGTSPAAADIVVAVDGLPTPTPEKLAQEINTRAVGDGVRLLVFGAGRYREVSLTLKAAPGSGSAAKGASGKAGRSREAAPASSPTASTGSKPEATPRPQRPPRRVNVVPGAQRAPAWAPLGER
jgi:serine protease Do